MHAYFQRLDGLRLSCHLKRQSSVSTSGNQLSVIHESLLAESAALRAPSERQFDGLKDRLRKSRQAFDFQV